MRSVADFYQDCLNAVGQQPPLDVQLVDAVSCVLAEDVRAPFDLPVADLAACDGYAVRSADLAGAAPDSPVTLSVTEEVRAGTSTPPPSQWAPRSASPPVPRSRPVRTPSSRWTSPTTGWPGSW